MTILVTIATLLLCVPVPPPKSNGTSYEKGNIGQKTKSKENTPNFSVNGETGLPNASISTDQTATSSRDLLNTIYLISAPFVVIVGVATGILVWRQVITLKKTERAWIMVNIEHTPGMGRRALGLSQERGGPQVQHTDFVLRYQCINHGKTPAVITEKRAAIIMVKRGELPRKPRLKETKPFDERAEPLAPRQRSRKKEEYFSVPGYQGLDDWIVLYGVVKYIDVFGKNHRTTFGYRITIGDQIELLPGSYVEYNKNR